ncbi:hypothetical protein [Burkholderia cepacia]|uniref:Uncharacterized protein n=1 Tax=Burkholderia cepacia TaxID=292 RepID=A0A8I1B153_BURCE|nr:hypothetical protein [Burkholderia cepacia]MBH9686937.1 hypothetical protein [Burkholderia cepacia]MBH9700626.1 hypothetical protein [Burkholderia cepacia]MBH9718390.1 hypothetical protein [Burkholderia cepacia]MBH9737801.1 hypothetical protein [Burkholderia cepacia]MBX3764814.1 hypothetical protein [Burkholderia cepacia]
MMTTVNELWLRINALRTNSKRKEVAEIAFALEYLSLTLSPLPDDIFSLYLKALSDTPTLPKRGMESFISGIYNDFDKLTAKQKKSLLETLINNSKLYGDENLRFSVGDMISRKYSIQVALDAFRRMWASGEKNSRLIAQFGANTLSLSLPKDGQERNELRKFEHEIDLEEK